MEEKKEPHHSSWCADMPEEIEPSVAMPHEYIQPLADIFKVLGDPTRLRILHTLMKGECCVCALAETIGMGQSAVSHQLRVLRQARLVQFRKEGKVVWYSLADSHVYTLLCQGLEHVAEER